MFEPRLNPAAHHQLLSYVVTSVVVQRRPNVSLNCIRVCARIYIYRIVTSFRISCTWKRHATKVKFKNFEIMYLLNMFMITLLATIYRQVSRLNIYGINNLFVTSYEL